MVLRNGRELKSDLFSNEPSMRAVANTPCDDCKSAQNRVMASARGHKVNGSAVDNVRYYMLVSSELIGRALDIRAEWHPAR